ncbi:hypothetical protein HRI_003305700 [Hibiscus trionum]|uniref:MADS-box domain-containing protein n=1 Tax=Hibiscus trionum TaxID=183268 RepID=A0A9W7MDL2_HIBTR|nr:hypothetical protein HRI_003305700 [Hibiscus trionum]
MEAAGPSRKGCGRRKIEIKKIENQRKRWVAFSKRKKGLLSKADSLSRLSGEDIGIVIISEQGRVYTSDNADAVIHRYRSIVKDKINDDDVDAVAVTHRHRTLRIVKEREDENKKIISKFELLSIERGASTITEDDGHVGYGEADSNNGRAVEEHALNPAVDFLKMKDEEIKGKDCLIDLNKIPDDDLMSFP